MSDTCACVPLADAIRLHLTDQSLPDCPIHDLETAKSTPIALNDDTSLKAIIGAALGAPINTTKEIQ